MARWLGSAPLLRRPLASIDWIHRRLSNRGDTEHEQALIRIAIVGLLLVYASIMPLPATPGPWWVPSTAQVGYIIGPLSILHFAWIVADPAVRHARRAVWMVIDHAGIVLAMAVGGELMAFLYPLLLWVTLGHGFRYGHLHLIGSALISVALFTPLVFFHPVWQTKGAFGIGLILGLILIPGYCVRLLRHLHEARHRAEASSEAKSRFLATMSHELRTPLHAILGMADLLRGTTLTRDQRDMTRTIHRAGHGLLNMIEDILDIARIEAGAERTERVRFDAHQLVHDIRDMLDYRARTKGLALHLRFAFDLPADLEGPRRSLEQVLINLVTNAIKFTDEGVVRVEAALEGRENDQARLRLNVVDTGCGIPESAHAIVFDRFTQADDTTTRRHGGSGLGLAIVKRLVEHAGGSIELQSKVDHGTRFDVRVPVIVHGDIDSANAGLVVVHGELSSSQERVLGESGLDWRPAAAVTAGFVSAQLVDLWCDPTGSAADVPRHGRDLIAWTDADAPTEALVTLPLGADAVSLRRAVRAALLVAYDPSVAEPDDRVHVDSVSLDVLVADDHLINRQVIERLLLRGGHRVVLVESGEAALEALARSSFDALILDLNMPGMGGIATVRELVHRAERPRLVALTADATANTRQMCLEAGFDAFLTKPVDGRRLLEAVAATLPPRTAAPKRVTRPATAHVVENGASTSQPLLDERRLAMLRDLDDGDDFVAGIIDGFIEDGEGLIAEIKTAAEAGDLARFGDAAHALRSAATHLGATALFEACLAIKSLDEQVLADRAMSIGDDLDRAFAAVKEALLAARQQEQRSTSEGPARQAVS